MSKSYQRFTNCQVLPWTIWVWEAAFIGGQYTGNCTCGHNPEREIERDFGWVVNLVLDGVILKARKNETIVCLAWSIHSCVHLVNWLLCQCPNLLHLRDVLIPWDCGSLQRISCVVIWIRSCVVKLEIETAFYVSPFFNLHFEKLCNVLSSFLPENDWNTCNQPIYG